MTPGRRNENCYHFKQICQAGQAAVLLLSFIQGHVFLWGHSLQPCLVETSGKTINASRANTTSKTKRVQEKLRMTRGTPTNTGISHKGTITGMCFLNFSLKHSIGFFLQNFAAMRPYPQGQDLVFQYLQNGHTNIIIQKAPIRPYAR